MSELPFLHAEVVEALKEKGVPTNEATKIVAEALDGVEEPPVETAMAEFVQDVAEMLSR